MSIFFTDIHPTTEVVGFLSITHRKVLPLGRRYEETRQECNQRIDKVFRGATSYIDGENNFGKYSKDNFDHFTKKVTLRDTIKAGKLCYTKTNAERKPKRKIKYVKSYSV